MATNLISGSGEDAIKGGIFFGSNLTPNSAFKDIPEFIESIDHTTNSEPRITMTLASLKEQLQNDAKTKNQSSVDILSEESINTFLINYVQLLIDYKDLRNFVFFGSSVIEMKYQIDYLKNNYPYKAFIARNVSEPYLLSLINYTDTVLGVVTDLVFRFDDIQQGANYKFDVTGETIWPNFEVQSINGSRYPIISFNNAITTNLDLEGPPLTITFHREIGGNDYGVKELKDNDVLTFIDNSTGDIKAVASVVPNSIIQGTTFTTCTIENISWKNNYTSFNSGMPGDYVIMPASICFITIKNSYTINDFSIWYKNETEHFKGFLITPTIQKLVNFEIQLDGIKKLLLDNLNPTPWPRYAITNNIIVEGEEYEAWLNDPNNLIVNYTPDKDGLASEPDSGFNMVSAWTMDEGATNQLLLRAIPHRLVDEINDIDDRYFSRFIWLAGKMFDTIKVYIDFLKYTYTLNYSEFNQLSPEFYKQYADHYGFELLGEDNIDFSKTLIFTEAGLAYDNQFNAVYNNEYAAKTLKALQYERQKRLLINLFYLYQKKGTIQCIEYLTNLIGSPRGLVLVEEYALDRITKNKLVDNVKIHIPTYTFELVSNYQNSTPIYKMKLDNEGIQNLREISIDVDILNSITEDILKYGKSIYPYGLLKEKTFANLQSSDNDYYLLPLSFPDKFSGITFSYNIPRDGLKHGWGSNDSEITFNLPSVYKVKPINYFLHINSITVNGQDFTKTNIAIDLLNVPLGSSTIYIQNASELIPDANYVIEATANEENETIFTIGFDISTNSNAYLGNGNIKTSLPAIINKTEKFNYKIPPIFLAPDEFPQEKTVDELITYKGSTSIWFNFGEINTAVKDGLVASVQVTDSSLPTPTSTIISSGWTWVDTSLEENVVKIVESINNIVTSPNFTASYIRVQDDFIITIEYEYTSVIGVQPYLLQILIDDGSGNGLSNDIDFPETTFSTYLESTESEEYIIARLEGRDIVVRLKLISEIEALTIERVAIFKDYFDNDGLNHLLKLIYRPEGVEVYRDYKYLGLSRWLDSAGGVWTARNIPKSLFSSLGILPLPIDMFSYPSDTTTMLRDSSLASDLTDWWDLFIGYGSGIDVYVNKVSVFENLFISQADYLEQGLNNNNYEVEKWSFNFNNQIRDENNVYVSDRIKIPCTYRTPNPIPPKAFFNETTVLDVFFTNNSNKINLTSKNLYGNETIFFQSVEDFFIIPAGETYSFDTLFKYNAYSPTQHTDYTYQNFNRIYDNYYTFATQVLTYYNLNSFIQLIEQKFKPLIKQFIPVVINMVSFGKTLKNNIAKVRYPKAHFICQGRYAESKAKAQFRVAYGAPNSAINISLNTVKKDIVEVGMPLTVLIETRSEHGFSVGDLVKLNGFHGTTNNPSYDDLNGNTYPITVVHNAFKFSIGVAVNGTWIPTGEERVTKQTTVLFNGVWNGNNELTAGTIASNINASYPYPGNEIVAYSLNGIVSLVIDVQGYWNLYGQNINEEKLIFNLTPPAIIDYVLQPTAGIIGTTGDNCIIIQYNINRRIIPTQGLFIFYDLEEQLPLYSYFAPESLPGVYIYIGEINSGNMNNF